jgi:hypothetical protein
MDDSTWIVERLGIGHFLQTLGKGNVNVWPNLESSCFRRAGDIVLYR